MSKREKESKSQLVSRSMKRNSLVVPLVIGLSLFSLTCQKSAQFDAASNAAIPINNSNGTNNSAASQPPVAPQTNLKVGDPAPDFTLTDTTGQLVKLSDFQGKKNVVLAFYVLAFTGG